MADEKKMWDVTPKASREKEQPPMRVVVDGWENFPMMVLTAFKWIVAFILASIPIWFVILIISLIISEM